MRTKAVYFLCFTLLSVAILSSFKSDNIFVSDYKNSYNLNLNIFISSQQNLLNYIKKADLNLALNKNFISKKIDSTRLSLKAIDFWLRYLEPVSYKQINGPLPVEWETEVFEKFEKPYKRLGAGLTLAYLYLQETNATSDSLTKLIEMSAKVISVYKTDSITKHLNEYHHFYLCNRLFLLNLATIYTTGFECPNAQQIIPELKSMLISTNSIYKAYNTSYGDNPLSAEYLNLYKKTMDFANTQPSNYETFNHYTFLKDYINPLFTINQQLIRDYKVVSKSYVDFALNKKATSIFKKDLFDGQNVKGVFIRVNDEKVLAEIEKIGKLLFYDPILSNNNLRSCASCHKPTQFFADTATSTSFALDKKTNLSRNSPTLINVQFNHLLMLDGKHLTLQEQTKGVITNSIELGSNETEVVKKILSCNEYKDAFTKLLKYTPQEKEINLNHICSAITLYYSKFSKFYSPFDDAIHNKYQLTNDEIQGYSIFMSKAQCGTCHFAPQFNGVKPPYVSSEFEVLGTPIDTNYSALSKDKGRFTINAAHETANAFRTGTVRNAEKTKPYMHNGVFTSLSQVINFYNVGGGAGRGLKVNNQTLSSDSLNLTQTDVKQLIAFIKSLTEDVLFEELPTALPKSKNKQLNNRKVGGEY